MRKKPEISLRLRSLQYLARREHSRAELNTKLLPHVQPTDNLDALLDDLEKRKWLSDERVADNWVQHRRSRFGSQRIIHELRQKGIAENLISAALPELKQSELSAARAVWQKKFTSPPQDAKEKARQMRFLQSRGFGFEIISKVLQLDFELE
jgi:regulatory protein